VLIVGSENITCRHSFVIGTLTNSQLLRIMPKSSHTVKPSSTMMKEETVDDTMPSDDDSIVPRKIMFTKRSKQDIKKETQTSPPAKIKSELVGAKLEDSEKDNHESEEATKDDKDTIEAKTKKGLKADRKTKGKVRAEVQEKILAYLGQELQVDRKDVTKQEVAEACEFKKAGSHGFFYAWQDLERTKQWVGKSSAGKGLVCLTDAGRDNIPTGVILAVPLDNAGKQQFFKEALLKSCDGAIAAKLDIIFGILEDGKKHHLDEFTKATGYANLKSKGLGYPLSHMEKKMKIVEKADGLYWFTDKCFPKGRLA
jgi:hypothetical protein